MQALGGHYTGQHLDRRSAAIMRDKLLHGSTNQPTGAHRLKRVVDVVGAALAFQLLLPLLALVAIAIRLTSKGPILFRQRRTGLDGQEFVILKFRTMTVCEDGNDIRHASRFDARVTRVGSFLRRTSIDELPQLFNVLKGEMSLVGPRPHATAHDEYYGRLIPTYTNRFRVRPGITGAAQVRGLRGEIRSLECMRRRVEADCEYASNWSVRGDMKIIATTAAKVLRDSAAY